MTTISTRLHGAVDYAVALLFGRLATSGGLPSPVRGVLGAAGAYHTSYSLLTDYEAGIRPRLSMRQHLALDALGGVALCAAGLGMTRQPAGARTFLVAAGLTELAVVALSRGTPVRGPGDGSGLVGRMLGWAGPPKTVGYPPLDVPKPVADGVWIVDSLLSGPVGRVVAARMTVIRLRNGDLLLHSPTRFSPALNAALRRLGRIRHLVAPNLAHWMFLEGWQRACPDATTWMAPGVAQRGAVRRSGMRLGTELGRIAPAAWGGDINLVMVPGAAGFHEAALFHRPSRTLVLTDLVMNLEPRKVPALLRPVLSWFGSLAPDGMPPPYLRALINLRGPEVARAAARLLDLRPERVIFSHGRWFDRDGTAALRRSLRWALA